MDPSQVVLRNQKHFEKIGTEVAEHHNYRCNRSDFYDAAEIMLLTISGIEIDLLKMPMWNKQQAIRDWDDG
ncbi:hypothetical protein GCM10007423_64010 [Dyadobacter endophyticus]|uniref:Uncharacterized protein n=2 Tax=Dyadobacter endophyticus TaxID=1749036 RepID=A0ABQ1ZAV2_9BACT|nr:hypothetical protein GCM10007423_64010 [Dyadobacter endophyticus]